MLAAGSMCHNRGMHSSPLPSELQPTGGALLACVGPGRDGERVVRHAAHAARLADATWHAVYVETPRLQRLPSEQRRRILETLQLAQRLGASTAVLAGSDIGAMIAQYARAQALK